MVVTSTIRKSVTSVLDIASKYLDTAMERVSESTFYLEKSLEVKEPVDKKTKTTMTETNKIELKSLDVWDRHIHAIFEMLDITEVGGKDDLLTVADQIKLAQMSAKYFFLCMIVEGMWCTSVSGYRLL